MFQIFSSYLQRSMPVDVSGSGDITVGEQHFPDQLIPAVKYLRSRAMLILILIRHHPFPTQANLLRRLKKHHAVTRDEPTPNPTNSTWKWKR